MLRGKSCSANWPCLPEYKLNCAWMSLCHDFAVALQKRLADLEAGALHMFTPVLHCHTAEAACLPCRFRTDTEMCQDGAACQHPLCVHAHSLSELQASKIQKSIQDPQQVTLHALPLPLGRSLSVTTAALYCSSQVVSTIQTAHNLEFSSACSAANPAATCGHCWHMQLNLPLGLHVLPSCCSIKPPLTVLSRCAPLLL